MSCTWDNNTLNTNRFDGINSFLIRLQSQNQRHTSSANSTPASSTPKRPVIAERITDQNKDLVAALPDPQTYTRMKNPTEPSASASPRPRRQNPLQRPTSKQTPSSSPSPAVGAPNCHEEIPFSSHSNEKYHPSGPEIVALAFEYTGNPARDREQLQIFAKQTPSHLPHAPRRRH